MASYSNPSPDKHLEVLYRQTYNTYGDITTLGLTQDNKAGNPQKVANTRITNTMPKGILGGSVVAVAGNSLIGPCIGDSTTAFDMAVGIAVNDALGNPFESSSAVASNKVVYAHGTGTVIRTDLYETFKANGSTPVVFAFGDLVYSSANGLLINAAGMNAGASAAAFATVIGIVLTAPSPGSDPYMTVQLRI